MQFTDQYKKLKQWLEHFTDQLKKAKKVLES